MVDNTILLKAYAAVPDESAAKAILENVSLALSSYGKVVHSRAARYWKIEEYFEICLELRPFEETTKAFLGVLNALGTGWELHCFDDGGDWAVWNPKPSSSFSPNEIRWANIECLHK